MRMAIGAVLLAAAAAAGCGGTKLRVVGYPQADVYVTMPGAKDFSYVGRTAGTNEMVLEYEVPEALENTKVPVLVKTSQGSWKYTVFMDRDQTLYYPPEGAAIAGGGPKAAPAKTAVAAKKPEPPPPPPPAGDDAGSVSTYDRGGESKPALSPADEPPSAEVSPE